MTRTIAPRLRTLMLLFLAATGALLAGAGPASAHAALTGSSPGQGVVVQKAPTRVSLTFSEKVATNDDSLRVLDPGGKPVQTGRPANVSGTTYAVRLRNGLAHGTYTVTYQVVSADSHPVSGAYTFSIGAPSQTVVPSDGPTVGGGVVGELYAIGRYASYAGFILLAGGAAFVLACWQRGAHVRALQRLVVGGWLTLTAATLSLLLLRGSYTTSGKLADVFDLGLLGQVPQTRAGTALVSRLLLLAAAALFIAVLFGAHTRREEDAGKRDLTLGLSLGGMAVAVGLATSWAMAEHASVGLQPGIAMPVDVVHLLAVAAWLGGLAGLLVALYRAPAETPVEAAAVRRFSRMAFGSVLALIATGIYQSWRQLGSWSALTGTRYGQLLLIKIGLVALLVGIASASRRWTAQLVDTATPTGTRAERAQQEHASSVAAGHDSQRPAEDGEATRITRSGDSTGAQAASVDDGRSNGDGDSRRAAQLARQRAAVDAARQKRLRDADPIRFGLRRSVLAEAGVAIVLLAITTALTQTEPGRTEQEVKAATSSAVSASADAPDALALKLPFDTGGADGKGVVSVVLDPARPGENEMHLYVQRPNGQAFDVPEVKISLRCEAKEIGPLRVTPDHISTGHWSASGVQIPMAGDWKIAVTVRTSDIDQTTVSKNAQIG
ncbi:copper resistance CopC/CopD family protein [Streptomyces sp. MUM 16J]|uniref:copper resistance CopC/CopD family protein n=1 Tax=Streptomyces sp. MUM 16J TaxID=2791988 RepID=UPI001F04A802|nr:copper resistance protein CopC [Streptomyces sp. MUM 16J]MCH0560239.1 copper resistance protein CopC/CopD [Streptomyces sp. MUM 16J]